MAVIRSRTSSEQGREPSPASLTVGALEPTQIDNVTQDLSIIEYRDPAARATQDLTVVEYRDPAARVTQCIEVVEYFEQARVTQVLSVIEFTAPDVVPPVGPVGKSFATIV